MLQLASCLCVLVFCCSTVAIFKYLVQYTIQIDPNKKNSVSHDILNSSKKKTEHLKKNGFPHEEDTFVVEEFEISDDSDDDIFNHMSDDVETQL